MSHCDHWTCQQNSSACEGCKDGKLWCDDPRCTPNCQGCQTKENHDIFTNLFFLTIIIILIVLVIVIFALYGPDFIILHDGDMIPYFPGDVS